MPQRRARRAITIVRSGEVRQDLAYAAHSQHQGPVLTDDGGGLLHSLALFTGELVEADGDPVDQSPDPADLLIGGHRPGLTSAHRQMSTLR
jgi:hypothetical protein